MSLSNQNDILFLLEIVRQIHQKTGELSVFLECLLQDQQVCSLPGEDYDPDAYLTQWINEANLSSQKKEVPSEDVATGGDCYA